MHAEALTSSKKLGGEAYIYIYIGQLSWKKFIDYSEKYKNKNKFTGSK